MTVGLRITVTEHLISVAVSSYLTPKRSPLQTHRHSGDTQWHVPGGVSRLRLSLLFCPSRAPCLRRGRRARPIRAAWLASHKLGRPVGLAGPAAPESLTGGRPCGPLVADRTGAIVLGWCRAPGAAWLSALTRGDQPRQRATARRGPCREAKRAGWLAPACPCEGRGRLRG